MQRSANAPPLTRDRPSADKDESWDTLLNGPASSDPGQSRMAPSQPQIFLPGGASTAPPRQPIWATKAKNTPPTPGGIPVSALQGATGKSRLTAQRAAQSAAKAHQEVAKPLAATPVGISTSPNPPTNLGMPPGTAAPSALPSSGTATGAPVSGPPPMTSPRIISQPTSIPHPTTGPPISHPVSKLPTIPAATQPPGPTSATAAPATAAATDPYTAARTDGLPRKKSESWEPSTARRSVLGAVLLSSSAVSRRSSLNSLNDTGELKQHSPTAAAAASIPGAGATSTAPVVRRVLTGIRRSIDGSVPPSPTASSTGSPYFGLGATGIPTTTTASARPLPSRPAFPARRASFIPRPPTLGPAPQAHVSRFPPTTSRRQALSEQGSPAGMNS